MKVLLSIVTLLWLFPLLGEGQSLSSDLKERFLQYSGKYAYEINYFSHQNFVARKDSLTPILVSEESNNKLNREKVEPSHTDERKKYFTLGIKTILKNPYSSSILPNREFASEKKTCNKLSPLAFSLTPFKRGDLLQSCQKLVEKGSRLGFQNVTLFYPIHYSGGNSPGKYKMGLTPKYGVDYRFEDANNISYDEFEKCLDIIAYKKLGLRFIPHLESIVTLNNSEALEWRMLSGIPIDDVYFEHAFGPFVKYLKTNPDVFRKTKIQMTIAAEMDSMFLMYPEQSIRMIAKLKKELSELKLNYSIVWNTNGDFNNGWGLPQVVNKEIDCQSVHELLGAIDGLTPSMYGEHQHLASNKVDHLDVSETVKRYRNRFKEHLRKLCPQNSWSILDKTKVGFGELAIDAANDLHSYADLVNSMGKEKDFIGANFWNQGKWDHLGLTTGDDQTSASLKYLKDFVSICGEK